MKHFPLFLLLSGLLMFVSGCLASRQPEALMAIPTTSAQAVVVPEGLVTESPPTIEMTPTPEPPTSEPPTPIALATRPVYEGLPTPDDPHIGEEQLAFVDHLVTFGETLGIIADLYSTTIDVLLENNGMSEDDFLQAGQTIRVPMAADVIGTTFKIIPDSELVYGPAAMGFDTRQFLETYYPNAALRQYIEEVEGRVISGPQIVDLVAIRYSINPRLLLAALEHRSGWVTRPAATTAELYPMGFMRSGYEGLFQQLNWAANRLNEGYYGRAEGGRNSFSLPNGIRIAFAPTINDGTAGVQNWLAAHTAVTLDGWLQETGATGFLTTYERLFGNPFGFTVDKEMLFPDDLEQPPMQLPWEEGVPWYFTSGPHGGWAAGSAWASLDFAPDRDQLGCYISETWVTAAADGQVVFSDFGGIILDLDGDGFVGTGWSVVYWHVHEFERIPAGEIVDAGDRLGHASCEGGFSNGTHLHLARRYNGRWVAADGPLPFNLDGWISQGTGREYDGFLVRGEESVEACACAEDGNEIVRE